MAPWEEPVTLGMGRWGRSIRTYARVRGAILGGALVSVLAVTGPATPLVAAEPEPVFHMPFPCGETWSASTRVASSAHADSTNAYPAHDPSVWATDWNHASPEGLPDDRGMAVLAGADGGTVTEVHLEDDPASIGYGNYVTVAYPGGVTLLFAHLGSIAVAKDDRQGVINAQTEIGRVGATGLGTDSTADHLHYEQQVGGGPRPIVIESRTWTVGDDPATVDIRDDRGDLASHPGVSHVSENCAGSGPGDPADVTTKPDDLPTRLPWAAGTSASITAGYGQEVVPGDWASVRFGLAPGSDVVAATTGDILYAGPATGRFAGLGNIVIERRMVGDRDFELLYTGLATVQPALSFTDSGHVVGTAGDDGVGFAILEGAQLVQGGDTGLAGGTPVYPEPLLGDGWYEHFQWWPGPMTARDLDTAAGDPWARWARGTARDAGHIALGDGVDIVTHVTIRRTCARSGSPPTTATGPTQGRHGGSTGSTPGRPGASLRSAAQGRVGRAGQDGRLQVGRRPPRCHRHVPLGPQHGRAEGPRAVAAEGGRRHHRQRHRMRAGHAGRRHQRCRRLPRHDPRRPDGGSVRRHGRRPGPDGLPRPAGSARGTHRRQGDPLAGLLLVRRQL